jgi:hypothetical protein
MLQKLKDLQIIVAGSRKAQFFMFAALLAVLFMIFKPASRGPMRLARPAAQAPKLQTGQSPRDEFAGDLMERWKTDVEGLKNDSNESKKQLEETQKNLQEYEQRTAEIMKRMLERMNEKESSAPSTASVAQPPADAQGQNSPDAGTGTNSNFANGTEALHDDMQLASLSQDDSTLESFGLEEPESAPPAPPEAKKIAFIGAGDSVRVKLLAGVNAPTDGTPYPVVFKLSGDIHGPDGSILPLGEARLIAAAQGSLTDQRALFRLTSMNIRLPSGERKVVNVDGWIVGEDGIRGMPGVLIDPIGKAISGAAFVGGLAGLGAGLSSANSRSQIDRNGGISTVVTGDLAQYAGGRAITEGAREWGSIIRDRVNQLVPVVKVYSGREGTAVFAKSLTLDGLFEALDANNEGASLD